MELDTGSAVSVMAHSDFVQYFGDQKLNSSSVLLKTYTGEKIKPLGVLPVEVQHNGQQCTLDLYIVKRGGPALWGRDWLRKLQLDWKSIKSLQVAPNTTDKSTEVKLETVLVAATPVFQDGIGTLKNIKGKIVLQDGAIPRFHKARPVPYAIRQKVEAELDRLEADGILSKVDWSPWATPIVPVAKKSGAVRVCGDFKITINPVLQAEQYPLPRIEDIFANLAGGKRFTKVDLAEAYLQMEIEEDSKMFLTINTLKGLYRYNRLVFGVASAPAIWQRAMDQVLQGIPGTQCYLDDIIVTGANDNEHLENLHKVLQRLQDYGLRARRDKCEFFKPCITYCGHTIDAQGLHKCKEKINAVMKAPQPQDVQQLRSFLGFINYYHRFMPNLSTVLHPLNELLQAERKWKWTKECEQAFQEVKRLVTSETVLTHYDPSLPVKLACDASPYGIGAVMSHVMRDGTERPIAFASRSLSSAEKNYSQIDKEALGLVWGVKRFNQYLYGREFTLVTDHQPLVSIFNPHKAIPMTAAARMQRWALFLGGHRYKIEFKSTLNHANADGLSRLPLDTATGTKGDKESVAMFTLMQIESLPVTAEMIERETRKDATLSQVYKATQTGWAASERSFLAPYFQRRDELAIDSGCLMWGMRIIIPTKVRSRVLEELHSGHLGVVKMKALARSYVWWPGIDQQIEQLAAHCPGCQRVQNEPTVAPLHTWEWPTSPWQRIHIDFAGPFMNKTFLVVVDACSKWPEVFAMKSTTTANTIDVLRGLFARTGIPEQLVSDNGPQFTASEFQMFMKLNGIRHITSAPYHPATNGLAERFVQTLKQGLRAFADAPISLQQKLANVLFAYRNATHATTNRTPAILFLGRGLRSRLDLLKPNLRRTVMDRQIKQGKGTHNRETRQLEIGQTVLARDYRGEHKWIPGIIRERQGPLSYTVEVAPDTIWRRHLDQLRGSEVRTAAEMVDPAASFIAAQGDLSLPTASATPETMSLPSSTAGQDSRNLQSSDSDMGCLPSPGPPLTPRIGLPRAGASPAVTPERRYPMRTHRPPKRLSL
uniref:Gypsy retrotransposon integrase-like protein 1 n=4 Tax=Knipowitschia caucasica TaxID=637954 RepID=A0AAV2JTD4_KNICA